MLGHDESKRFEAPRLSVAPEGISICRFALKTFSPSLDMATIVRSGLKNLNLVKTSQATFVGFHRGAYGTLQDLHERVLRSALESVE
jgi:hypothetical protein